MKAFSYVTALTPASAAELAGEEGRYIAGGIDLLGEMKENLVEPATLVNIKALPGIRDITPGDARWTIGAGVTLAALAAHAGLREIFPALAEAAAAVGSPQMRTVATVGGNLAQHSRCWYYRHRDVPCLKKGGKQCFARGGENKFHSLFTGSRCLSPCVSNLAVALSVLDATVVVQRDRKAAALPLAELYASAWTGARVHNSLKPGDLILRVELPVVAGRRSTYVQMGEKRGFDWALVSCAAAGRVVEGRLREARVALGCVAPIPWRRKEADARLAGQPPSETTALAAADALLRDAEPHEHNGYKVPLARALIRRAVLRLA
ncbi:MAG: FAD binding domain-containing protein [Verrucomicrobiota bacterium]